MKLTGYEKKLEDYSKEELVEIAEKYKIYYTTASGRGSIAGYNRLNKSQLIKLIQTDSDYKRANPNNIKTSGNRFLKFKKSLFGNEKREELMNEILTIAKNTQRDFPPIPGKYYTYIYYAKTPKIIYDQHPLIVAGDILPKGFNGFNYHWGKIRQYNTVDGDRLVSGLYEITFEELTTLRSIPYEKFVRN